MPNKIMVNTDEWPVCVMNSFPSNMDETRLWLEEMDLMLARREQFVLIYPPVAPKGKPTKDDMEGMKYVRHWLKQAKDAMVEHCKAMVVTLQADGSDKEEMERLAPMLTALYGPAVFIEENAQKAKLQAQLVLA